LTGITSIDGVAATASASQQMVRTAQRDKLPLV